MSDWLSDSEPFLDTARTLGLEFTLFVDAGMSMCMERFAASSRAVARMIVRVKNHVAMPAAVGHTIALHVRPH